MDKNKSLQSNIYSNIARSLVGAVLLFVVYRHLLSSLGVEKFGVWSTIIAITSILRFGNLGIYSGFLRYLPIHMANDNRKLVANYIETALITILGIFIFICPIAYFIFERLIGYIFLEKNVPEAMQIMPYALILVCISELAMTMQSAVDGVQRMEVNALIAILGQSILLVLVYLCVPQFGLMGVIISQCIQGLFTLICTWIWLKSSVKELNSIPINWDFAILKNLCNYGRSVILINISVFLMDPITKIFLAKFGDVSFVGYFELASQVAQKIRSVLLSANQAITPKVAEYSISGKQKVEKLYYENLRISLVMNMSIFSAIMASSNFISYLLIGEVSNIFINVQKILMIGWAINSIAAPAYFINLGAGKVSNNSISHLGMGLLNVLLAYIFGIQFGQIGVISAYCLSVIAGSVWLYLIFNIEMKIAFTKISKNIGSRVNYIILLTLFIGSTFFSLNDSKLSILIYFILIMTISVNTYFMLFYKKT